MRIVLAYSGGLDGSAAIPWLRERYRAEVVTVTVDLGPGRALETIRDRALTLGAQRAHVLDARDEFAGEFLVPALRADALHAGRVPLAQMLSRPLIARKVAEVAVIERADRVAHTGRAPVGSSHLDTLLGAVAPSIPVVTPVREWTFERADLVAQARSRGLGALADDSEQPESNLWGRSVRLESSSNPRQLAPMLPDACPSEPAFVDVGFVGGTPSSLNNVAMPLVELIGSLGMLASRHGVGYVEAGSLACDAPAAVLLHGANRELARAVTGRDVERFSSTARSAYVETVERARWFSPLREALDAYFAAVQTPVTGSVRLRLLKGEVTTVAVEPAANGRSIAVSSRAEHQ